MRAQTMMMIMMLTAWMLAPGSARALQIASGEWAAIPVATAVANSDAATTAPKPGARAFPSLAEMLRGWRLIGLDEERAIYLIGNQYFEFELGAETIVRKGKERLRVRLLQIDIDKLETTISAPKHRQDGQFQQRHVIGLLV